jgi:UDPglucose 6-dehydrogenase
MVGCGKLGLMVALTIESKGHEVKGYDISDAPKRYLAQGSIPFQEEHSEELLANSKMEMVSLPELCEWADIIFMAIQTPHAPEYEGTTPLPSTRADFDYSYLIDCVRAVSRLLTWPKPCVIISTVLPGTIEREIIPIIGGNFRLVYSPQFIAMGTVYEDFCNPEFWLIGGEDESANIAVEELFDSIKPSPIVETDIRTAEGIKVFYNTFVTAKTVLANLYGEMAHHCQMNVDDIFKAVSLSTRRLLSPKYLKAGMGDGGGCHPRDNIALSWLAKKIDLSYDFFESLMVARERHCAFLANLIVDEWERSEYALPVTILGRAFKPETNIETGSPALLLSAILRRCGVEHECVDAVPGRAGIFFIGCQHERYRLTKFPEGSVVIDPFRYISEQDGVNVVHIGKHAEKRNHRVSQPA